MGLAGLDRWQLKTPTLQSLVPNCQAVDVPIKHLQFVAATVDEQEQVARKRILLKHADDLTLQSVEPSPHIALRPQRCIFEHLLARLNMTMTRPPIAESPQTSAQ